MVKPCAGYPVLKVLGSGTFGEVYLSKAPIGGKAVAVKVIATSTGCSRPKHALKEVDLLRGLSHPNIVAFIHLIQRPTRVYIVMEFCDNGDLRDLLLDAIELKTPLTIDRIGNIFVQILMGLHHCHRWLPSKWVTLHRDLKPENILLSRNGTIKLANFGLSTVLGVRNAQAYSFVGTPGYLAPEILLSKPYGHKADVYSLGCILFELLTFELPDPELLKRGPSVWSGTLNSLSKELRDLTLGLLAVDPEKRWSTSDTLSSSLVACWLNKNTADTRTVLGSPSQSTTARHEHDNREQALQKREMSFDRMYKERLDREQALAELEKSLDARSADLRRQNRQLGAREAELEAKLRKFTIRASKSPSVEPEMPPIRRHAHVMLHSDMVEIPRRGRIIRQVA